MIDLDCGIPYRRIRAWLDNELGLPRADDGSWVFTQGDASCKVSIAELEPRSFSTISFERTHLKALGDEKALDLFEHMFTLRFISAGG